MKKKKVYVLMVSKTFPAYHPRKGLNTNFMEKILLGQGKSEEEVYNYPRMTIPDPKVHTIRENYDLWAKRAEKINKGEAILSLRQWTGSPYNFKRDGSKPVEFLRLEKIGVQRVVIATYSVDNLKYVTTVIDNEIKSIDQVAKNDGLSVDDFCKWFKKDLDGVMLHFSDFKY